MYTDIKNCHCESRLAGRSNPTRRVVPTPVKTGGGISSGSPRPEYFGARDAARIATSASSRLAGLGVLAMTTSMLIFSHLMRHYPFRLVGGRGGLT